MNMSASMRILGCAAVMLSAALAVAPRAVAGEVQLTPAREIVWQEINEPPGARETRLWGDSAEDGRALLVRWQATTKAPQRVDAADTHFVVLAGTLTIEVDGVYRELGPAGFANVPAGKPYKLGCEAAGECTFLAHRQAPAGGP